jgi:ribosomal-protein-alanine N-acetyltransferase
MKTKRLNLRPLCHDDASRIAALAGVWEVASMTGRIPYPYSAEAAQDWVDGLDEGEVVFGIEHEGQLAGLCGYTLRDDGVAEFGYWLGHAYWGRGFATEAARALIEHGFAKGGVKCFVCSHFTDNKASARVIAKLGFRPLGPCTGWSEARQQEMPALKYERRRSWISILKARAS